MKIAAGEWLSTVHEFKDLIEIGRIDVAQPDIGRVGGLSEAKKVSDLADKNQRIIVPHCWKTSISISATAHFAFNTPSCAFIEYLPEDYKTTNHTDEVFNFVCKIYLETKQPIRPIQIREGTTLQKTAVQRHLNILVEQNLLSQ